MPAEPSDFRADCLAGARVLVTGASSGLGRHFAHTLAAHGAHVVVGARRVDALRSLVDSLRVAGGHAEAVALDVRDAASVDAAVAAAGAIDGVVNNAGVASTQPALETDDDAWSRVIDTNLSGAFRVARAAARSMVAGSRRGAIVNIASILAYRVTKQVAAYVAAKAGLVRLTEALALEFARHGIRVNAIAPGYVETDINRDFLHSPAGEAILQRVPTRRFGVPSDLDGALLLLLSRSGAHMTGSTIVVDGGHSLA